MRVFSAIVALGSTLGLVSLASAQPATIELARGCGGPLEEEGGPGNEQAALTQVTGPDGAEYVMILSMTSDVYRPGDEAECELRRGDSYDRSSGEYNGPWQCQCSAIRMDEDGPTLTSQQIVTNYRGERPCNHPQLTSNGETVLATFGSDHDRQANVATYAGVLNTACEWVGTDPIENRISEDRNSNEGAPDIISLGGDRYLAGYLSQGGEDTSHAVLFDADPESGTINIYDDDGIIAPANIGRPTMMQLEDGDMMFCAAKGDQRPPEYGIECARLEITEGGRCGEAYCLETKWRELVAESDPDSYNYANQPLLARSQMDDGGVSLLYTWSMGHKRKDRGENEMALSKTEVMVMHPDDEGARIEESADSIGMYQTHAGFCSSRVGETDSATRHVGVFDASITGSGLAGLTLVSGALDVLGTHVVSGENADSGYLANIYGQNPNDQGREFLRCIGDVSNPGFAIDGGFKPEVEDFWVLPFSGNIPGQPKNALFVSFLPATSIHPEVVTPPAPEDSGDMGSEDAKPAPGGGVEWDLGGPEDVYDPEPDEPSPDRLSSTDEPGGTHSVSSSACSIDAGKSSAAGHGGAMLMALVGVLAVIRRRFRR